MLIAYYVDFHVTDNKDNFLFSGDVTLHQDRDPTTKEAQDFIRETFPNEIRDTDIIVIEYIW